MFRTDRPYTKIRQIILWGGLFLFTLFLQLFARKVPGFAERYAATVYPVLMRTLGGISNLLPFALDELLIYLLTITVCGYLMIGIRQMWKKTVSLKKWMRKTFWGVVRIGILWFLIFTVNCGINYHRIPFSMQTGLSVEKYVVKELEGLCLWLTEEIEKTSQEITTQENGLCALPENMREKTRDAMMELGDIYPSLSGWYPKAKPVFTWPLLSYEFLEGIAGPYTMEAHYNPNIPAYNQPAVLCHELSHLKGFMREDEANYIAYLACRDSEDANIRYSGLMLAYTHSINALYGADYDSFVKVRVQLCEQAELDYAYHRYYWDQFEGPVSEVADKVNDAYLKANAQKEAGVMDVWWICC